MEYWYNISTDGQFLSNIVYYEYKYDEYRETKDVVWDDDKTYFVRFYSQWCDTPYDERLTWRGYTPGHKTIVDGGVTKDVFTIKSLYGTGENIKYFPSKESNGDIYWEADSSNSPINTTWKNQNLSITVYTANKTLTNPEFIITTSEIFPKDKIGSVPRFYEITNGEYKVTTDNYFLPEKKYFVKNGSNFILAKTNQKFLL